MQIVNSKSMLQSIPFQADFVIAKQYQQSEKGVKKAADKEKVGTFFVEGYASTSDVDCQYSRITPEALHDGAVSLQKYQTLLFNHDMNRPIGKIQSAEVRGDKLHVKCSISQVEQEIIAKIQDGTLSKFSIMGEVLDADQETVNDEEILVIKSMRLFEVSLVSVPANVEAKALNWYIEKSLLSQKNIAKASTENVDSGYTKEDILNACTNALEQMQIILADMKEEDKNNCMRIIQWLQSMKEKYDPDTQSKKMEEDSVKRKIEDADMVNVLEPSPEKETEVTDAQAPITKSVEAEKVDAIEKSDSRQAAVATEKVVKESDKVEKHVKESDQGVVLGLSTIVDEIKVLAKGVVGAVDETKKNLDEAKQTKEEIVKALAELREILKSVAVRNAAPKDEEQIDERVEKRRKSAKDRVDNYDKLSPVDQLRAVLAVQMSE